MAPSLAFLSTKSCGLLLRIKDLQNSSSRDFLETEGTISRNMALDVQHLVKLA